jgi:hypothetical protein
LACGPELVEMFEDCCFEKEACWIDEVLLIEVESFQCLDTSHGLEVLDKSIGQVC